MPCSLQHKCGNTLSKILSLYITKRMNLNSKKKQEAIRSYLRIKPILSNDEKCLDVRGENIVAVRGQDQYSFNKIFDENSTNEEVFETIGNPLIDHSLQGYNACVLAYGQTSSGKTFTMKGEPSNLGLIPLTVSKLFSIINDKNMTAEINISYFQIYNENIIDLLSTNEGYLDIREDYKKNISIVNLNEVKVSSVEEAMKYFEEGESRRKFSSNNVNQYSSRSHTIFRVALDIVYEDFSKSKSIINMVDLAGSEGVSKTKAEGNIRKEGDNINKSILALSNVIRHMSQKQTYVNFRDSKLTRILQSSLCSNSRSIVICTINPITTNLQQTLNTIKFGVQASNIKLSLKQNYNASQFSKSQKAGDTYADNEKLLANERIEYQENKRNVATLREQNQSLRDAKRKADEKIEFLELEIHRQERIIKNYQEELERHRRVVFKRDMGEEERQLFQTKIEDMKAKMNVMADKYEALNEFVCKLQTNEKFLLDRISKYQTQIAELKQNTLEIPRKILTPRKPKSIPPKRQEDYCPLTIGSIVSLKTEIIKMKQQLWRCHEDIAKLMEQRNQLDKKVDELEHEKYEQQQNRATGKINPSHQQQKEIKYLMMKIKKLKREIVLGKNRENKLRKLLREHSKQSIEDFDQFNEWLYHKNREMSAKKGQLMLE